MTVSYRKNANYKNQFEWTNELNENLHKDDLKILYMNRMKKLWKKNTPRRTDLRFSQIFTRSSQ